MLQRTLKYLINLVNSEEHPFEVVHDFVFDRTRSIRQDLSMQNINDDQAISMYEEMVQVHYNMHVLIVAGLIFEISHAFANFFCCFQGLLVKHCY